LPVIYHNEAKSTAVYLFNRTIHGSNLVSPYQLLLGKAPRTDYFVPFGCIGQVFIPAEKRSKTDAVRQRCRMIGYSDCDDKDTEILAGYKVLLESSNSICYSNDIVWLQDLPVVSIPNLKDISVDTSNKDHDYQDDNSEFSDNQSVVSEQEFYSAEDDSSSDSDFSLSESDDSISNIVNLIIKGKFADSDILIPELIANLIENLI
jgi:hypothetical protein